MKLFTLIESHARFAGNIQIEFLLIKIEFLDLPETRGKKSINCLFLTEFDFNETSSELGQVILNVISWLINRIDSA